MLKTLIFLPTILITLLFSGLSWTAAFAQDSVPMTCGPYDLQVAFMSAECTYAPSQQWSADQIPYISITESYCCTGGGNVCTTSCSTNRLSADALSGFTLKTAGGAIISTTLLAEGLDCNSNPLIAPSRPLTVGQYSLTNENYDSDYEYFLDLDFEIIDEVITLELPPSEEDVTAHIEGYMWVDMDEDGIRDEGEPGVADISIDLINVCWGNNGPYSHYQESHSKTVASNSDGFFQFTDVSHEMYNNHYSYALRFSQNREYTMPNQGDDETQNSDVIASCEDYLTLENNYRGYQCIIGTTDGFRIPTPGITHRMNAGIIPEKIFLPIARTPIISNSNAITAGIAAQKEKPIIRINDFTIYRDQTVIVPVEASSLDGLHRAIVNVTYDPEVLSISDCFVDPDEIFDSGVCKPTYAADTLQFAVVSSSNISGDLPLAKIAFRSNIASGSSILAVDASLEDTEGLSLAVDVVDGVVSIINEVGFDCSLVTQITQSECEALVDIYQADPDFFESNRSSWLSTTEPCHWKGVGCIDGYVTALDFMPKPPYDLEMDGPLPDIIDPLADLSPAIGNISKLSRLNLSNNRLETLPAEMGNLSNLTTLNLSGNRLATIPLEIQSLSNLLHLNLNHNYLLIDDSNLLAFLNEKKNSNWTASQAIPPTNVSAEVQSDGAVSLKWKPIDNESIRYGPHYSYYEISTATTDTYTVHGVAVETNSAGYVLTDISPNTTYKIRIRTYIPRAVDRFINSVTIMYYWEIVDEFWSDYTDVITATTPPLADPSATPSTFNCGDVDEVSTDDCQALVAIYYSTNGPSWIDRGGWLETVTPCSWKGVICGDYLDGPDMAYLICLDRICREPHGDYWDRSGYPIVELRLGFNNLTGILPPEIVNFSELRYLDLHHNRLASIPPEIKTFPSLGVGGLTAAQLFPFYDCDAINEIPLTECKALVALYLSTTGPNWSDNTGWLEAGPCSWHGVSCEDGHVIELGLTRNGLAGMLPSQIGSLSNLTILDLNKNQLSSIPPEIGNLSGLIELKLNSNRLSHLPSEVSNLSHLSLQGLDLDYNSISTADPVLQAFLDEKDSGWADTQTVAPTEVVATALADNRIQLSWTPISFQQTDGYYEISITTTGEDFTVHGTTISLTEESYIIDRLSPATAYQIRLRTFTRGQGYNHLWSDYTDVITATTLKGGE